MQRRRLLRAFCEVAGEQGLEQAGIGQVCKRAGVSRRTFYDIFDDREACFVDALDQALERIEGSVRDACEAEATWAARVAAATATVLEIFDREPATARMCVVESLKASPEILDRRARLLVRIAALVDRGRGEARRAGEEAPSALTAESVVGGALSVIHTRLLDKADRSLSALAEPLTSMILRPYLGSGALRTPKAKRAGEKRVGTVGLQRASEAREPVANPFGDLPIRFTYRTARTIAVIAENPGASNRVVGEQAGIADQGQISKLLSRLYRHGLIESQPGGRAKGDPYAWTLTDRGWTVHQTLIA
ncbi:MAG: TetR/AcrR family transcriptional regulator [Solirubrobacteraceae bacterium]